MHHIKKLHPNFQYLFLNFKICNFVTKKTFPKKKKKLDLYLMKIHISFVFKKKSDLKIQINFFNLEKI